MKSVTKIPVIKFSETMSTKYNVIARGNSAKPEVSEKYYPGKEFKQVLSATQFVKNGS